MTHQPLLTAGFIGLGAMGMGMARNLAKQGYLHAVYNRSADKAEQLAAELSVQACASPQALAALVDVVLICVSADADVLEMVAAVAETAAAGTVVIDHSTVSRHTAEQAAALLQPRGVAFLDAPVSGGVEGANNGTLAMMVGGSTEVLKQVHDLLSTMAARIEHLGDTGAGQACKAVNQIMAAGINQAVTEALAFAAAQHLAMDKVIEVVSGGAAGNWFLQHRGHSMTQGHYTPGFKVALHHKDLRIVQQMAAETGMACPLTDTTVHDYATLMQQGLGESDISALYQLKRKPPTTTG